MFDYLQDVYARALRTQLRILGSNPPYGKRCRMVRLPIGFNPKTAHKNAQKKV